MLQKEKSRVGREACVGVKTASMRRFWIWANLLPLILADKGPGLPEPLNSHCAGPSTRTNSPLLEAASPPRDWDGGKRVAWMGALLRLNCTYLEKAFHLVPLSMMIYYSIKLAVGFCRYSFIKLRKFSSIPSLLRAFIMNGDWILPNAFQCQSM